MSNVWQKYLINQRHTRGLPPEGSSVEYTWRCRYVSSTGAELQWDPFSFADNVVSDSGLGLPRPGDTVDSVLDYGGWSNWFRFRTLTWALVPESVSTWDVTAVATSKDVFCPDPVVTRADSVTSREVDVWRDYDPSDQTVPGDLLPSDNYVDLAGKPIKKQLGQIQITITFLWNTADPRPAVPGYPDTAFTAGFINTRNNAEFLGFDAGSLRIVGVNIDPEQDEYLRVSVQLLWDRWFHMTQQPLVSSQGQPLTTEVDGVRHAVEVHWEQLYGTTDWADIFHPYEIQWLTEAWSARDEIDCSGGQESLTGEGAGDPIAALIGTPLRPEEDDEEENGNGNGE